MKTKKCNICFKIKNINQFYKHKGKCKECISLYNKNHYKKYYIKNRDKIIENKREYYKKNKEEISKKDKIRYYKNIDYKKKYNKSYYKKNENKIKQNICNNNYNINKKRKEYIKNNIEEYLLYVAKNRAKRNEIGFNLISEDVKLPNDNVCPLLNIKMKVNNGCAKYNSFTLDKLDPFGSYSKNNILVISRKANASKSNSTIEEYETLVNNLENILNGNIKIEIGGELDKFILKTKLSAAKRRANKKNLFFYITKDYIKSIFPKDRKCPLLRIEMVSNKNIAKDNSISLDRIIPSLGYIKNNVIWISYRANRIKNNLTLDEMKLLLKNWKRILEERF